MSIKTFQTVDTNNQQNTYSLTEHVKRVTQYLD